MELLTLEHLTFYYPSTDTPVLQNLSLSVKRGDFLAVCGTTGSGKSTLLRLLKRELTPRGKQEGSVRYRGSRLDALPPHETARFSFVMQDPEKQIVTDTVWHELAFGLENLGVPPAVIAARVAETASYFGIESWYDKPTASLSGGQKQLLNLAAVTATDPEILLLDEPTAQLDPIAAAAFLQTLKKLNRELSITVILVEHRLEEVIPLCNRLLVLQNGSLVTCAEPRVAITALAEHPDLLLAMPAAARLAHAIAPDVTPLPLTVTEGRHLLEQQIDPIITALPDTEYTHRPQAALRFTDVFFRYEKQLPDVLTGLSFTVYENEIFCLLGGNGSGKTTALTVAAALRKAYHGRIEVFGKKLKAYTDGSLYRNMLSLLPQDVETVFLHNTVREELAETSVDLAALPFDLRPLLDTHPYDLSGGEKQLVALAKILGTKPRLLLMDEPTKGLDAQKKADLIAVLKRLKAAGMTVIIVSHDLAFSAQCADRCGLLFRGTLVSCDTPERFFSQNRFYTTAESRMTHGFFEHTVTTEQILALCRQNPRRNEVSPC